MWISHQRYVFLLMYVFQSRYVFQPEYMFPSRYCFNEGIVLPNSSWNTHGCSLVFILDYTRGICFAYGMCISLGLTHSGLTHPWIWLTRCSWLNHENSQTSVYLQMWVIISTWKRKWIITSDVTKTKISYKLNLNNLNQN